LIAEESNYIERTVEALAELDLAFAKAKYAEALDATTPVIAPFRRPPGKADEVLETHPGSTIDLRRARHPLLNPETVVPIDVQLGPDYFVIIITGPNTGGKTVSLKTVGLLAAMAQAGLAIPAQDGSRLSVFDGIYADIGDEQSIEQNLSTFSSHLTHIVDILQRATPRSLVLLDELGAGTDPDEGSALAQAILSHLIRRRITTVATTHYSELKVYAHATAGAQNASVEFDLETLSPTYELSIGLPGRSNAFAIARRLGMSAEILDEAIGLVSSDSLEAESLLSQIKTSQQDAIEEKRRATAAREAIDQLREELNEKLGLIEAARREVLEEARQQARQDLDALREELGQMRAEARAAMASADISGSLKGLERSLEQMEEAWEPIDVEPAPAERGAWVPPRLGDTVWVDSLNAMGEVTDLVDDDAEVQAGAFRVRVPIRSVVVRQKARPASPEREAIVYGAPAGERPATELDLRGMRAEEALIRLDKYLDDAAWSNLPWVRIIHGYGTGTLRQLVRERLSTYRNMLTFRAGAQGEGGDGVTVVSFTRAATG
jgi:DNA mismatch repair protein MutS2